MFLNGCLYFSEFLFGYINHLELGKILWCSPLNDYRIHRHFDICTNLKTLKRE